MRGTILSPYQGRLVLKLYFPVLFAPRNQQSVFIFLVSRMFRLCNNKIPRVFPVLKKYEPNPPFSLCNGTLYLKSKKQICIDSMHTFSLRKISVMHSLKLSEEKCRQNFLVTPDSHQMSCIVKISPHTQHRSGINSRAPPPPTGHRESRF